MPMIVVISLILTAVVRVVVVNMMDKVAILKVLPLVLIVESAPVPIMIKDLAILVTNVKPLYSLSVSCAFFLWITTRK
jgi:hypothetical protein